MIHNHRLFAFAFAVAVFAATMPAAAQRTVARSAAAATGLARRVDSLFSRHVRPDGPGCAVEEAPF